MYCRNCGKELPDGSKFCTFCGTSQEVAAANQESEKQSQSVFQADLHNEEQPVSQDKRQKIELFFKIFFFAAPFVSALLIFIGILCDMNIVFKILLFVVAALWFVSCFLTRKRIKQKYGKVKGIKGFLNTLWSILAGVFVIAFFLVSIVSSPKESENNASTDSTTTTKVVTTTEKEETTTEPIIEISAKELINEYQKNEIKANDMFKGKRLRVTGYVAEFSQAEGMVFSDSYYIYIDYGNAYDFNNISCYLNDSSVEKAIELKKGDKIVIEGNCTGFSFSDVKMSSCDIIS